jgi:uncharacterized protein YdeI (YjbR/CyaY-like superfamily)
MSSDLPRLGRPAERALADAGIASLARLSKFTEAEVAQLHGVGPTAMDKLRTALHAQNRSFKTSADSKRATGIGEQAARFFKSPAELRRWLARNGERESELWVGVYRKSSGKQGITYEEAVRQALCFGWIDGVRRSAGADGSAQRFTPRTPHSTWSALNLKRYAELEALGLIAEPGKRAYARRNPAADGYAIADRRGTSLDDEFERRFAEHPQAWKYYQAQAPWYRRETAHWIASAKREDTRERRFATLLADSAAGRRIDALNPQRFEAKPAAKQGAA